MKSKMASGFGGSGRVSPHLFCACPPPACRPGRRAPQAVTVTATRLRNAYPLLIKNMLQRACLPQACAPRGGARSLRIRCRPLQAAPGLRAAAAAAPARSSPAEVARTIAEAAEEGTLSIQSADGWPLGARVAFVLDEAGQPVLCVPAKAPFGVLGAGTKASLHIQVQPAHFTSAPQLCVAPQWPARRDGAPAVPAAGAGGQCALARHAAGDLQPRERGGG